MRDASGMRRRLTIEAALCAAFAIALGACAVAVVRASRDEAALGDLGLRTVAGETQAALRHPRASRVVTAAWPTVDGPVTADTIALSAPDVPSMTAGGFIADEVAAYNRAQRRAAWLASSLPPRAVPGAGLIGSSAILDAAGRRDVVVDVSALTVPSPFAERGWRTVLAHDSRQFTGILRSQDVIEPKPIERLERPDVRGPRWCTGVVRPGNQRTDLYCGSLVGLELSRNAEVSLLGPADQPDAERRVQRERARHLWSNGGEITAPAFVRGGDVLYTPRTGAMVVSRVTEGIVAATSVVNGQRRFLVTDGPLRPLAIALARSATSNTGATARDSIVLALHGAFTRELDSATAVFLARDESLDRAEVVVVDNWSGGVRALAGRSRTGALPYVPGFEPGFVGSLVKPLLATAILSRQPALASLAVDAREDEMVRVVRGIPVRAPFSAGHSTGRFSLPTALQTSNNKFFVELVFASLAASAPRGIAFDADGNLPLGLLESSALAQGLLDVFDVQAGGDKSGERDESVWWTDDAARAVLPAMRAQRWYWPWASRPSLFVSRPSRGADEDSLRGTSASMLARFAYGQGLNEWTLLGAAQGLGRVVTGRAVTARMLARQPGDSSRAYVWRGTPWAGAVRQGMRLAASDGGTADGLSDAFAAAFGPRAVEVYAKTGTAQTDDQDDRADRNTLGIVVAVPRAGAPPDCGVSVALAIDYRARARAARAHRDFAERVVAPLVARHWESLVACRR